MLSVFKLVSCRYIRPWGLQGAGSEGPQGLRSYKLCSKFVFGINVTVIILIIYRNKFDFVGFLIVPKFMGGK